VYSGNTDFAGSTSAPVIVTINPLTVTTTTITGTPNPAAVGETVILNVNVSPSPTGSPLGTVDFYNGTALLGSFDVSSSGAVTFAITGLPAGANSLSAVYSGNTAFAGSTSAVLSETIEALIATVTALTASPNPAAADQSVTLAAAVSPIPTGTALGTVSFFNGTALLATAPLTSSGSASFSITSLPGGTDSLTAQYSGNLTSASSTSPALTETVQTSYTVTVPAASVDVSEGGSVEINVSVPSIGGAFNNPVTLSASGLPVGATATFNPSAVTPGGAGAATVLTIQLASVTAAAPNPPLRTIPMASLIAGVGLCGMSFSRKRLVKKLKPALMFTMMALMAFAMTACGSESLYTTITPPGNFVVIITGTSGSTHASATVTLVVK